jgi:phage shock protein E
MHLILAALFVLTSAHTSVSAQSTPSYIDYSGFRDLTSKVETHRATRLISWSQFAEAARDRDTLILDARSADAYAAGHIRGAVNLPFTDFTAESLARVIGRRDRPILIYCNNNFRNDVEPVRLKALPLALNIQTFINLVGYGYSNVRELGETIDLEDPKVGWVKGPAAEKRAAMRARALTIPGRSRR